MAVAHTQEAKVVLLHKGQEAFKEHLRLSPYLQKEGATHVLLVPIVNPGLGESLSYPLALAHVHDNPYCIPRRIVAGCAKASLPLLAMSQHTQTRPGPPRGKREVLDEFFSR